MITLGVVVQYEQVFAEVPRYTDALLAAWSDDQSEFDTDVYHQALVQMGHEGQTGFVLVFWARLISLAHESSEQPFQPWRDNGTIEPRIADHGVRLVETARSADLARLLPLMLEISRDLGDQLIQKLIYVMAWTTKRVLTLAGGRHHLDEVAALISPCAERVDAGITVESLSYALAVVSYGHLDRAQDALTAVLRVAPIQLVFTALISIAVQILPEPGQFVVLDEDGIPESVVAPGGESDGEPNTTLLSLATDTIRAVKTGTPDQVGKIRAEIAKHPEADRVELLWQLTVSLGYKLASMRKQGS